MKNTNMTTEEKRICSLLWAIETDLQHKALEARRLSIEIPGDEYAEILKKIESVLRITDDEIYKIAFEFKKAEVGGDEK